MRIVPRLLESSDQMTSLRNILLLGLALVLSGCATESFSPDQAPEYVTIRDFTPFYRNGPMQARGADSALPADTRVKLIRREMGFSLVQLEDTRSGYVANENMAPAPPRPPAPPVIASADDGAARTGGRKKRGGSSPAYRGEQLNDIPLPDPNVPPPDLNIAPEEVPAATPVPTPAEKPKFRF